MNELFNNSRVIMAQFGIKLVSRGVECVATEVMAILTLIIFRAM